MFDVFQNVLFGKKKEKSEKENSSSEVDDFVLVGQTSTEQASGKEVDSNEPTFPKNKYFANNFPSVKMPEIASKTEETYVQNVPLQDVPFTINSALSASAKLDQIWQGMGQVLSVVDKYKPFTDDYDFSLERSVIAETMQK